MVAVMLQQMNDYFSAEKHESLLFVAVGIAAIVLSVWLWSGGHRLKAMAFPLVAIALIQLVVGGTVFLRTDTQVAQLQQTLSTAPAEFKAAEIKRLDVVMKNFTTYKTIEVALIALGACLVVLKRRHDSAVAVGAGLLMQAALMLILDLFAEARGDAYLLALTNLAT